MTDGMYGDLSLDELDIDFVRGTYRLRLADVQDHSANVEEGELPRKFRIFNFEIDDDNPDVEDFRGEQAKGVFLNYWPELNRAKLDSMSSKEKTSLRKAVKLFKTLAEAFGVDQEQIKSGQIDWENYIDHYVYATLYKDKRTGDPAIQTDSIVSEQSVEI